jgi:hypothetical protein
MTTTTVAVPTGIRWGDRILETSTGTARAETDAGPAYVRMIGTPDGKG